MLKLIKRICSKVGRILGFSKPTLAGGIVILVVGVVIAAVAALIIIKVLKNRKANQKANTQVKQVEKVVLPEPAVAVEEAPVASTSVEEAVAEPVVAEEPVEEPAEVVVEAKEEPKVEVKKEAKKTAKKEPKPSMAADKKEEVKASGKWIVEKLEEDKYIIKLVALNNRVVFTSKEYATEYGVKKGVEVTAESINNGLIKVYEVEENKFCYKLRSKGKHILCVSANFDSKENCIRAVERLKKIAEKAEVKN